MTSRPEPAPILAVRTRTFRITCLALGGLILLTAIQIAAPHWLGQEPGAIDFKVFRHVGQLSESGRATLPYDATAFEAWQAAQPGGGIFMPWTYPPQANLFTEMLASLPTGLGYVLYMGIGLAGLIWALHRLARDMAVPALMLTLPAILMNIRAGQNGFLTALLFALTFLFLLRARPAASGLSLGLLAYKPHLGLGIGLVALFRGGWTMVLTAAAIIAALAGLATLAYGSEIWPAFLQSVRDSGNFLRQGAYPMERMTSLFALLTTLGLSAAASLAAQAGLGLGLLGLILVAIARRWRLDRLLALSCIAGLGLSPYGYDYDLVAMAPGLALALPDISAQTRGAARPFLVSALILATGWGLLTVALSGPIAALDVQPPALGALGYLVALAVIIRALYRAERLPAA